MRRWVLAVFASLLANIAFAANYNAVLLASRDEEQSEEQLPAIGLSADFGPDHWMIRPEVGLSVGFDPVYGDSETELSVGGVRYWEAATTRIHFGAGVSSVASDFGANSGTTTGVYVHAGMSWGPKWLRAGFDVRYLSASDLDVSGESFPVGYLQVGLLLGW